MQAAARRAGRNEKGPLVGAPAVRRRAGRFVVIMRPRQEGMPGRLGITVAARIGRAVRRNRIKRLVREAYRTTPDLFPEGHDVIAIASTGEGKWTLAAVREELRRWR